MDGVETMVVVPMLCLVACLALEVLARWAKAKLGLDVPLALLQFSLTAALATTARLALGDEMMGELDGGRDYGVRAHLIMTLLLPPLVFDAAFRLNSYAFVANWPSIVIMTVSSYGVCTALHTMLAYVNWSCEQRTLGHAFFFAAIISATDPAAVIALLEHLGAPYRLRMYLEGESLLNDGLAIICYHVGRAWIGEELGQDVNWWAALPLRLLALPVTLLLVWLASYLVIWLLNRVESARQGLQLEIVVVYGTYMASEWAYGSGVISLVALGLLLSRNRSHVRNQPLKQSTDSLWELAAHWANSIIFTLAGYFIGSIIGGELGAHYSDFVSALLLYPQAIVVRVLFMSAACYVVPTRLTLVDYICFTWGGMRGALALLLSLQLFSVGDDELATRNLIYVSTTVTASLLLKGLTFGWLARRLGLQRRSSYRSQVRRRLLEHLLLQQMPIEVQKMQADETQYYAGANWATVEKIVGRALDARATAALTPSGDESLLSAVDDPWELILEKPSMDGKRAYLGMLLARVQTMCAKGDLSARTARRLEHMLDHAVDEGDLTMDNLHDWLIYDWRPVLLAAVDRRVKAVAGSWFGRCWARLAPLHPHEEHAHYNTAFLVWLFCTNVLAIVHLAIAYTSTTEHRLTDVSCFASMLFCVAFAIEEAALVQRSLQDVTTGDCRVLLETALEVISSGSELVLFVLLLFSFTFFSDRADFKESVTALRFWVVLVLVGAKVLLAAPLFVQRAAHEVEELVLRHTRITLSALNALDKLSDEMTFPRHVFPNQDEWFKARELNNHVNELAHDLLLHVTETETAEDVLDGETVLPLLKTRQAVRALIGRIIDQVLECGHLGNVAKDDADIVAEHMRLLYKRVGRLRHVSKPELSDQLLATPWLQTTADANERSRLLGFLIERLKRCEFRYDAQFDKDNFTKRVYFLQSGIALVEGYLLEPEREKAERYFKYCGTWLALSRLLKTTRPYSYSIVAVTSCVAYALDDDDSAELLRRFAGVRKHVLLEEFSHQAKQMMRSDREVHERYTNAQLKQLLLNPRRMEVIDAEKELQVPKDMCMLIVGEADVDAPNDADAEPGVIYGPQTVLVKPRDGPSFAAFIDHHPSDKKLSASELKLHTFRH